MLDEQKVRNYLDKVEAEYLASASAFDTGILYQIRKMREDLERGEFSVDMVKGERLRHKENKDWGVGRAQYVYKEDRGVLCIFPDLPQGRRVKFLPQDELELVKPN